LIEEIFMPIGIDNRIKFGATVALIGATGSLSVEIFGGALARVQATIFAADDSVLQAIGYGDFGPPLTTEVGGRASWLFQVATNASYMKWSVQAVRSAANLGDYSVTSKVRNADGDALATGQFSASIATGQFADDIIYDGVNFASIALPMPAGTDV
jgi:hypothetical protein